MAELYVRSQRQRAAAEKWLKVSGAADGVTLFDLLGLGEADADPAQFRQQSDLRLQRLQAVEAQAGQTGQAEYTELALQLRTLVQQAVATLSDPAARAAYLDDLLAARRAAFERTLRTAVSPGRRPAGQELEALLAEAAKYRLDTREARRLIESLTGSEGPYAAYGVLGAADDPAGLTHFDLLGLDEAAADERLIRAQRDAQLRLAAEKEAKTPEQDRKRHAREYADKVRAAAAVLADARQRQAYCQTLLRTRQAKFQDECRACYAGGAVSHEVVIRLLTLARRMRLGDGAARQTLTAVTGFADYMSLLGARRTPVLGQLAPLKFDIRDPADGRACRQILTVRNDGGEELRGRVSSPTPWLRVTNEVVATRGGQAVEISVEPAGLPRGLPSAGQLRVDTDGGSQIVPVEVVVAGGEYPESRRERLLGGLVYLAVFSTLFVAPMVMVFIQESKSRFLTTQAAQASVLGVLFLATLILSQVPLIGRLGGLLVPVVTVLVFACAAAVFMGRRIRVPVVAEYAARFA